MTGTSGSSGTSGCDAFTWYCPKCGHFNWDEMEHKPRYKCMLGQCDWTGTRDELLDTQEKYLNNKRYDKLNDILNERTV